MMRLNARQVFYAGGGDTTLLLGIKDVTGQRALTRAGRMLAVLAAKTVHIDRRAAG
jgi:hypothetical protein